MKHLKVLVLSLVILSAGVVFGQRSSNVEMQVYKAFWIQSAMSYGTPGGCWDLPGGTIRKDANIQAWNIDQGSDRKFTLVQSAESGFYEMYVGGQTRMRVDISGARSSNGTNVQVWDKNGSTAQRFAFVHLGNGRFKIYDRNGKVICLKGRKNSNGTNIHIWDDHNGPWVEWYLIDPSTSKAYVPNIKPAPKPEPRPKPTPKPSGKKSVMPTKR